MTDVLHTSTNLGEVYAKRPLRGVSCGDKLPELQPRLQWRFHRCAVCATAILEREIRAGLRPPIVVRRASRASAGPACPSGAIRMDPGRPFLSDVCLSENALGDLEPTSTPSAGMPTAPRAEDSA